MCGIFGMTSKTHTMPNDDKFLKNCTIAGSVRGVDSTGFVFLETKGEVKYLKRAMNGASFIEDVFDPVYHMGNTVHSVIGHNRAATVGSIDDDSAHPFVESKVIGVHNGTLTGDWRRDLEVSKKCDIDSKGIFRAISARGIDWTIKNLYGAAALVWAELETQKVFVYRNYERPLSYAIANNRVYYASEAGMLSWLLSRAGIKNAKIQSFKTDTLYEITKGDVVELREMETSTTYYGNWDQYYGYKEQGAWSSQKALPHIQTGQAPLSPIVHQQQGVAYRGVSVSPEELEQGIMSEWAETGFGHYQCFVCNHHIDDAQFYESVEDPQIKVHHDCFNVYRAMYDSDGRMMNIIRDPKLKEAM